MEGDVVTIEPAKIDRVLSLEAIVIWAIPTSGNGFGGGATFWHCLRPLEQCICFDQGLMSREGAI